MPLSAFFSHIIFFAGVSPLYAPFCPVQKLRRHICSASLVRGNVQSCLISNFILTEKKSHSYKPNVSHPLTSIAAASTGLLRWHRNNFKMCDELNILCLPEEVLREICSLLSYRSLCSWVLVCRAWRQVGEDLCLWRKFPLALNIQNVNDLDTILRIKRFVRLECLTIQYHGDEEFSGLDEDNLPAVTMTDLDSLSLDQTISTIQKLDEKTKMTQIFLECRTKEHINPQVLCLECRTKEHINPQVLWICSIFTQCVVVPKQHVPARGMTGDNPLTVWSHPTFTMPDTVAWANMASALNMMWTSACGTNRSLTEDNLYCLACKVFNTPDLLMDDLQDVEVSWDQICMETLPGRDFTFWDWFYQTMNLTADHLRDPWSDGYIMGFVSKNRAEELLMAMDGGTFLLRFSDSEPGVTIAYVRQDTDQKTVMNVAPFTSKDLSQRSIAYIIFDLQEYLSILFPDTSKEVFRKFLAGAYEEPQRIIDGYVSKSLKKRLFR